MQPHSASYLPGFLPQYSFTNQAKRIMVAFRHTIETGRTHICFGMGSAQPTPWMPIENGLRKLATSSLAMKVPSSGVNR